MWLMTHGHQIIVHDATVVKSGKASHISSALFLHRVRFYGGEIPFTPCLTAGS